MMMMMKVAGLMMIIISSSIDRLSSTKAAVKRTEQIVERLRTTDPTAG
jgi:hypothetical protein